MASANQALSELATKTKRQFRQGVVTNQLISSEWTINTNKSTRKGGLDRRDLRGQKGKMAEQKEMSVVVMIHEH